MSELLTSAQMRAIEQAAIASGEVTGLELMERAGRGVVEAIFAEWPELAPTGGGLSPAAGGGTGLAAGAPAAGEAGGAAPATGMPEDRSNPEDGGLRPPGPPEYLGQEKGARRATVLCGPGNNGGDGFVVARLLAELGWAVEVFLYGDADKLPPDARVNYDRWREIGGVHPLTRESFRHGKNASLFVDAIFGTGLGRAPEGELLDFLKYLGGSGGDLAYYQPRLVAIDAPSGLCLDSGRMLAGGEPFPFESSVPLCRLTVTFDSPKIGHFVGDGPACCGKLAFVDIGLAKWREIELEGRDFGSWRYPLVKLISDHKLVPDSRFFVDFETRWLGKHSSAHKYTHGHALVLAGPSGKGGAARLAARGALRVGAGVVTLAPTPGALQENAARLDAIMLAPVGDAGAFAAILEDARLNALALGPGLGHERARELVPVALSANRKTVLDADALAAYTSDPGALFEMVHEDCVLTPHAGEFARLFPDIAEKLAAPATKGPAYSKVDATREAAKRAGCVVLYKGPDTVIADQLGRASVNAAVYDRAAPWLATAGAGDVLAGMSAGLLARGFDPKSAAETAAWLHVQAALSFGPGLIAEDLPEELPKVLSALGL